MSLYFPSSRMADRYWEAGKFKVERWNLAKINWATRIWGNARALVREANKHVIDTLD